MANVVPLYARTFVNRTFDHINKIQAWMDRVHATTVTAFSALSEANAPFYFGLLFVLYDLS